MPKLWPHTTHQHPCGACGKPNASDREKLGWCTIGDKGYRCMRIVSPYPFKTGGWFHPFDGEKPKILLPVPEVARTPNFSKMIKEWQEFTKFDHLEAYANSLEVSIDSVASIGACYAPDHRAWAFPMRDGFGEVIGIRLRSNDGRKWAVRGSKNGIFIPELEPQPLALLCEGPTSTAAAISLGFYAIGRPACHLGGSELKIAVKRLGIIKAVIVADNDEKPNGLTPGLSGANALAKEIGIKSVIWTPPTKDIRDFLKAGGSRAVIESEIKNFVWKKHS